MNFLLIDDDVIFNFIHEKVIGQVDPEAIISTCASCVDALANLESAAIKGTMPDIIFLDINMPEMSGFDFLDLFTTRYAGQSADMRVYMVTSSLNERDYERAMQYESVKGFFDKPLTGSAIRGIINEAS